MSTFYKRFLGGKAGVINLSILALLLIVLLPLTLDTFRLNLVGKYLTFAFVSIGLVFLWGKAGVLSLGQGVFFGLGGYCMAMYLKLEASDPITTKIQSTPGIPDFMDWNQITHLPAFWVPFKSLPFTLVAVFMVPALVAFIIGAAMFKRRVGGVYFAVITQAIALILSMGIDSNQGYTGGRNGITDLRTMHGWDIRSESAQHILYFVSCVLLIIVIMLGQWLLSGKMGKMLLAMRDREDRVRFSGYDVSAFKIFIFCLAAALSGLGGALFVLQVGFISPSLVGIITSIEIVIFVALGGKGSLYGAIYGTLLVSTARSLLSESFPQLWLFLMGGLFIAVVVFFPNGIIGLGSNLSQLIKRMGSKSKIHLDDTTSTIPTFAAKEKEPS